MPGNARGLVALLLLPTGLLSRQKCLLSPWTGCVCDSKGEGCGERMKEEGMCDRSFEV